ncbi:hypothetical protein [Pleomorphomonas koreensis]|uniref:hypothetical protein n=1 Tax=Pleomorphomonas koreensis TaxID=257440 RepID=UPI0003F836D4|nr:hypothetical protein [Pleomorphomonas koreensis]
MLAGIVAAGGAGAAESFAPPPGTAWVTIASAGDVGTAIGIARLYGDGARVVAAGEGKYAAVLDPLPGTMSEIRQNISWPGLPKDALLSDGADYRETVWQPTSVETSAAAVGPDASASVRMGDFAVTLERRRSDEKAEVRVIGREGGKELFDIRHTFEGDSPAEANLQLVEMDPGNDHPEVLFDIFTGGAHCCTATVAISEGADGQWRKTDLGLSNGGVQLEDVDGDGEAEILTMDDSFLYLFAPYSSSRRPLVIEQLRGGEVVDVSGKAPFVDRQVEFVRGMEFEADQLNPDNWHDNGFLAAWVASKTLIGEGDEAWRKMLGLYRENPEFGVDECLVDAKLEDCPPDKLRRLSFPDGLKRHLIDQGYPIE